MPGFGDFPIRKLEILADPHRPRRTGAAGAADAAAAEAGSSMDTDGAAASSGMSFGAAAGVESEPEPGAVLATLRPDPAKQMDREYEAEGPTLPLTPPLTITPTLTLTLNLTLTPNP